MKTHIIPKPQIIQMTTNDFYFPDEIKIFVDKEDKQKAGYLADYLTSFLAVNPSYVDNEEDANIILKLDDSFTPGNADLAAIEEAYRLKLADSQIYLVSRSYRGLYYGCVTLKKLLQQNSSTEMRELTIIDYPDMKLRGISDDISRGQVSTLDNFKKIIAFISEQKMNTYMPYIEDVMAFDKYPNIGKDRGALTKTEIAELVKFANSRFVDIIPVFQTLGHYENILTQDEFVDYAEFPGAASLDVSNPDIYDFLDDLIKEVTAAFPGEYLHVGADESFDVGLGNSKALVEKSSIAEVHANHYKKVYNILKKYNRKMMMYGDIILRHPEILEMIPKDITIVDWHYGARDYYSSTKKFKDAGFQYIVSPSVWNFLTTYPANINALANIKYLTKSGLMNSSIGMINSNWGDYGAETFKELLYYGYAWSAQCAWSYSKSNISDFTKQFYNEYFGKYDVNVAYCHTTLSDPLNQVLWHEIWRHPLLKPKDPVWWEANVDKVAKILWQEMTLDDLEKSIKSLKEKNLNNSDVLDIWEFLSKLNRWYILKSKTTLALRDTTKLTKEKKKHLENLIMENVVRLETLKIDYSKIWKRYYKTDNLNLVQNKFDRLIQYFKETKEYLKSDTLPSPIIPSLWCYAKHKGEEYKDAEFEFEFNIEKPLKEAKLQLLGDSYAELYINGEYVDRVYARLTLSLSVDYKRIFYSDVKKYLRQGKNSFKVICRKYDAKGAAGFNILSELKYEDGTKDTLMTSKEWKFRIPGWEKPVPATAEKYRRDVIAPNFKTDRTSWIER